jgi:hypothetical protein
MEKIVYKYFKNIFKKAEKISEVWYYQISPLFYIQSTISIQDTPTHVISTYADFLLT